MVIETLRSDFRSLSTTMYQSINREPRIDVNIHKVIKFFWPRAFLLQLQTIQHNVPISKLLMNYLLSKWYNRLEPNVIKTTPKQSYGILFLPNERKRCSILLVYVEHKFLIRMTTLFDTLFVAKSFYRMLLLVERLEVMY